MRPWGTAPTEPRRTCGVRPAPLPANALLDVKPLSTRVDWFLQHQTRAEKLLRPSQCMGGKVLRHQIVGTCLSSEGTPERAAETLLGRSGQASKAKQDREGAEELTRHAGGVPGGGWRRRGTQDRGV